MTRRSTPLQSDDGSVPRQQSNDGALSNAHLDEALIAAPEIVANCGIASPAAPEFSDWRRDVLQVRMPATPHDRFPVGPDRRSWAGSSAPGEGRSTASRNLSRSAVGETPDRRVGDLPVLVGDPDAPCRMAIAAATFSWVNLNVAHQADRCPLPGENLPAVIPDLFGDLGAGTSRRTEACRRRKEVGRLDGQRADSGAGSGSGAWGSRVGSHRKRCGKPSFSRDRKNSAFSSCTPTLRHSR